jgi:hypothetical protein
MKHEYSTITLLAILGIISVTFLVSAISSQDIDDVCAIDGDILTRVNGEWVCSSTYYIEEDLRFPVTSIKTKGASNVPEYDTFIPNTNALAFDDSTMEQGFITMQLPHGRIDNTDLESHFHWSPSDNLAGDVIWCLEITCANIGDTFPSTSTVCTTDTADGINKHQMTDYLTLSNSLGISAICQARIYRDASNVLDTYPSDAFLHEFDIHYQANNIGRLD